MTDVLERLRAGEADPACRACGGILKSDTISFGQALVPAVIRRQLPYRSDSVGSVRCVAQRCKPRSFAPPLCLARGAVLIWSP